MNPDLETIRAKLAELGISEGGWQQTDDTPKESKLIERQKGLLRQARDLLQVQVDQDKKKLGDLHEVKNKLQHGGT